MVFDSTGLPLDVYTGTLCVLSNDPVNRVVDRAFNHDRYRSGLSRSRAPGPFAADPSTAVTVTLDGAPALTGFEYGDLTGYLTLPQGDDQVAIARRAVATRRSPAP